MDIRHDVTGGRFVMLQDDGKEGGRIIYDVEADGNLSAISTYVSPELRGQGVSGALLDALATHARKYGLKIIPVCSYVADKFAEFPGKFADVASEIKTATNL